MGVFDDDIETAKELILEFGQVCYWQKPAPLVEVVPGYPSDGAIPAPTECRIAFFSEKDLGRGRVSFRELIPTTEVGMSAEVGLLAGGQSFAPEMLDSILRGSLGAAPTAIVSIDRLAPNGDAVLYFIKVAA